MKQVIWKLLCVCVLSSTHCAMSGESFSYRTIHVKAPRRLLLPVDITLVAPEMAPRALEALVAQTLQAAELSQSRMGMEFVDDFSIFFDPRPQDHNGLTTVIPSNRIDVNLEAPVLASTIGLSRHYLTETLIHEMSHMLVTQARGGIFKFLDHLIGNSSRPMGAWPRWLHEGMAVWTEEIAGGRPASGMIEFDLRKFADYFERKKQYPFGDSDLDGNGGGPESRVESGTLPYHFGYLLVNSWYELRKRQPWGNLFAEWSKSAGLSFRVHFKADHHLTLDEFFKQQQNEWSHYPLLNAALPGVEWARASHIAGPFSHQLKSADQKRVRSVAWIESDSARLSNAVLKGRLDSSNTVSTKWQLGYSQPLQTFLLEKGWLVFYSQLPPIAEAKFLRGEDYARHFLGYFDLEGRELCRFQELPYRVREVSLFENTLAFIYTDESGVMSFVDRADFDSACRLSNRARVTTAEGPFLRFSSLQFEDGKVIYSRQGLADPLEYIEVNGAPLFSSTVSLSLAYPWGTKWVMHHFSKENFSPLLVEGPTGVSGPVPSKLLPLRTGSTASTRASLNDADHGGFLLVKESFWESDRLVPVKVEEFSKNGPVLREDSQTPPPPPLVEAAPAAPSVVVEPYSVWPSIVPQFWLPTLEANSGGYTVYGQTFFSDLREKWSGALSLGYDSYAERPFFLGALAKQGGLFYPFQSHGLQVYYAPTALESFHGKIIFQRSGSDFSSNALYFAREAKVRLSLTLGLKYEFSRSQGIFEDFDYFAPSLQMGLSSPYALNSAAPNFRLAGCGTGYFSTVKLRHIHAPEYHVVGGGVLAVGRTGFSLKAEWAKTDLRNYPASYFEFGGNYSFSTSLLTFLSRGFGPRLGIAKEIIRGEVQWGFPLASLRRGLSWNRFRSKQLDGRLIGETLTFAPFSAGRYGLGHGYFNTLGGELDVFGSLSQYVNFTATAGVYHGYGPYGENRIAVRITSYLDL